MDSRIFYSFGKIAAAGNSSLVRNYQFPDVDAFGQKEMIYYRLKQVDKDGKFTYSQVISAKRNNAVPEALVKLYPTVITASQYLQAEVTSSKKRVVTIRFYNAAGSLLAQTTKALETGKNVFTIQPGKALPTGELLIQFSGDDWQQTLVIIKK